MRSIVAIAVIFGVLVASAGQPLHACAMDVTPEPASSAQAEMPCHGQSPSTADEVMDCCDDEATAAGVCTDCLCSAFGTPFSTLENASQQATKMVARHNLPLSAAPPPERPPEFLLRPPILSV
jgi:hypothetical protein